MHLRSIFGPMTLVVALAMSGCGGGSDGPTEPSVDDDPPVGSGREVKASPSFSADIMEIFDRRGCSVEGCHGNGSTAGSLSLGDTVTAYAALVDVTSGCQGLVRVVPGVPDSSYLVMKVEGTPPCGARMPLGDEPLDTIDLRNLRNWVAEDALNN